LNQKGRLLRSRPLPAPRWPPGSPRTHKVHPPPDLSQHETPAHSDGKPPDRSTAHQRWI